MDLVRRHVSVLAGFGAFCLLLTGTAYAASGNAAGIYTVTITKTEISNDGGATYQTVFSGSTSINIASVNAGSLAASLASGVILAPGTYNRVRCTIGSAILFKGYVNNGSTTIYTSGGTDSGAFSTNLATSDTPGTDYATSTFTVPAASRTAAQVVTIVVSAGGTAPTVRVAFDTSSVLSQTGGIPSLSPPTVTITSS